MFSFMVTSEGGLTTAGYAIAIIAGIVLFLAAIYFAGKNSEKKKTHNKTACFLCRSNGARLCYFLS